MLSVSFLLFEVLFEGALLAELHGEIAMVIAPHDLIAAYDVGVVEGANDLGFLVQQFPHFGVTHRGQFDYLNRHCLVCILPVLLEERWTPGCTVEKQPFPSSFSG